MSDLLRMDYINSLPHPLMVTLVGGSEWPLYDLCVVTGLMRLDVCGKLDVSHIGEARSFLDMSGVVHDADTFYSEALEGEGHDHA